MTEEPSSRESLLSPQTLSDFIGQEQVRERLWIMIEAAKRRGEPLEHILLCGPDGVGRSTLAHVIAREMSVPIRVISGRAIAKQGEMGAILSNLREREVLFIGEAHSLSPAVGEVLCPAMRDFEFDFVIGKQASARRILLRLPRFTVVATAPNANRVPRQLLPAFGEVFHLTPYTSAEMEAIVRRYAGVLGIGIDESRAREVAKSSCGLPRDAMRLLRRVRDVAQIIDQETITGEIAGAALSRMVPEHSGAIPEGDREPIPEWLRRAVLARDDYICRYCGKRAQTMEVDHVVPVDQGGPATFDNLATACLKCNRQKGGRTPEEAGMVLLPPGTVLR